MSVLVCRFHDLEVPLEDRRSTCSWQIAPVTGLMTSGNNACRRALSNDFLVGFLKVSLLLLLMLLLRLTTCSRQDVDVVVLLKIMMISVFCIWTFG